MGGGGGGGGGEGLKTVGSGTLPQKAVQASMHHQSTDSGTVSNQLL